MADPRRETPVSSSLSVEESGRTVDDAVARALEVLGLERSEATIEVLDEGSRGVLGLGAREARVRVTARRGRAEAVKALAEGLLGLMGFAAEVAAQEEPESIRLSVQGENLGALIGKHGQTLSAIEAVVGLLGGRRLGAPVRVELDIMGYRERRRLALEGLATRTADRVTRSGREIALSPMDSRDRRIIHVALQDHPKVTTVSRGEGDLRRVVVFPREGADVAEREQSEPGPGAPRRQRPRGRTREPRPRQGGTPTPERARDNGGGHPRGGEPRQPRYPERQYPAGKVPGRGPRPSRRPWMPSGQPQPAGRPEGLPVDEELEAEIEAHLEKFRRPPQEAGDQENDEDSQDSKE